MLEFNHFTTEEEILQRRNGGTARVEAGTERDKEGQMEREKEQMEKRRGTGMEGMEEAKS